MKTRIGDAGVNALQIPLDRFCCRSSGDAKSPAWIIGAGIGLPVFQEHKAHPGPFAPRAVEAHRQFTEDLCHSLIDGFIEKLKSNYLKTYGIQEPDFPNMIAFMGRMALMLSGVRPIISRASSPTATMWLLSLMATTACLLAS